MIRIPTTNPVGMAGPQWSVFRAGPAPKATEVEFGHGDKVFARGEVVDIWEGPLIIVPALWLEVVHDPICRTFSGLWQVLQQIESRGVELEEVVHGLMVKTKKSGIVRATQMPKEG